MFDFAHATCRLPCFRLVCVQRNDVKGANNRIHLNNLKLILSQDFERNIIILRVSSQDSLPTLTQTINIKLIVLTNFGFKKKEKLNQKARERIIRKN